MNMNFCINCNSTVKDDEEFHEVDGLSASAIEILTSQDCEIIADSIICKECHEFISNNGQTENSEMEKEDIEPLVEVSNSQCAEMRDQKFIEANKDIEADKDDLDESHGTKRKLLCHDSELTAKTARVERVFQGELMAESTEKEDVNDGLDNGYFDPNFDADLWPEEADANINLIKPTVQVPIWSVPLHLGDKELTDTERNLKEVKDTLYTNPIKSSRQLQSKITRNQVDNASYTELCNVEKQCVEPRSDRHESCNSNDKNILSSPIPSPPPPPTWPSRLELKRLMAKLSDSNSSADTLTRHCNSKSTDIVHNQLDNGSPPHNTELTKSMHNHFERRSSGALSKECSVSVCKFNVGILSNDRKFVSKNLSNKLTATHNQESLSKMDNVRTISKCSDTNRKVLRNNEDMSVPNLNYKNQLFNNTVISAVSLMLATLPQNIPCRNDAFIQKFGNNNTHQKEQRLRSKFVKGVDDRTQEIKTIDIVSNEMLQPVNDEKESKKKKKRRGRPRNGGNRLPDGTRMKQYKRPLPGTKVIATPVTPLNITTSDSKPANINNEENILVSGNTEAKTSTLNAIIAIDNTMEKSELTVGADISVQRSVKENNNSCNFLKSNEMIIVEDAKEIELHIDSPDLPIQFTPLLKQVENYKKQTISVQLLLNTSDTGTETSMRSEMIIPDNTEENQLSANKPNILTKNISLDTQTEDTKKLNEQFQSPVPKINSDAIITDDTKETKLVSITSHVTPLPIPIARQIEDSGKEINIIKSSIQEIKKDKKAVSINSLCEEISAGEDTSASCKSKDIPIVDTDTSNVDTLAINSNTRTSFTSNQQEELKMQRDICGLLQENSNLEENAKASTESIISEHTKTRLNNVTEQDSGGSTLSDETEFQRDVKTLLTDIEQECKLLEFCDDSDESESIESSDNTNRDIDLLQNQQDENSTSKRKRKRRRTGRPRNGGNKYLCLETNRLLRNPKYERPFRPKPEMQPDLNMFTEPLEFQGLPPPPLMQENPRFYNKFPNYFRYDRYLDDPRICRQSFPGDRRICYDDLPIDPRFVDNYNRFTNEPSGFNQQMSFDRFPNDPRLSYDYLPNCPRMNNFPGDPRMYDDRFPEDRRGYNDHFPYEPRIRFS